MKKILFWIAAPVVAIVTGIVLFGTGPIGRWEFWISILGGVLVLWLAKRWLEKRWTLWAGIWVSVILLWIALSGLQLGAFLVALKQANYWWLIPGVAVYFVGVWVRAWRWHYLLSRSRTSPPKRCFPVTAIGYMGNNIYPARAGEVLRAVVLKRREGVPISASLATIIVERIFDGVVMLGFVFLNLPELAKLTGSSGFVGNIQQLALWGRRHSSGALVVFLLAAMFPARTCRHRAVVHRPAACRRASAKKPAASCTSSWTGWQSLRSPLEHPDGLPHLGASSGCWKPASTGS